MRRKLNTAQKIRGLPDPYPGSISHVAKHPFPPVLFARGAEVTGGVAYQFTPRFFARVDTKFLLQRNNPSYDQRNRSWIGLGWRF